MKFYTTAFALAAVLSNYSYADSNTSDYLELDFAKGWLDAPSTHDHSAGGVRSKYIHPITTEAAFNDNDFFIDYAFSNFRDEDEHEIEIELEYALTRRLGVVIETALAFETEGGSTENGIEDLEIAGRVVLAEYERSITTFSLGFGIPTGENDFSSDELILEPSLLSWFDFGYGITFNTKIGLEIGTRSDSLEFIYEGAVIKDFGGPLALSLESQSIVNLRDDEEEDFISNLTIGGIFRLNNSNSIRAAYTFPLSDDDFNSGAILSYNYSF